MRLHDFLKTKVVPMTTIADLLVAADGRGPLLVIPLPTTLSLDGRRRSTRSRQEPRAGKDHLFRSLRRLHLIAGTSPLPSFSTDHE